MHIYMSPEELEYNVYIHRQTQTDTHISLVWPAQASPWARRAGRGDPLVDPPPYALPDCVFPGRSVSVSICTVVPVKHLDFGLTWRAYLITGAFRDPREIHGRVHWYKRYLLTGTKVLAGAGFTWRASLIIWSIKGFTSASSSCKHFCTSKPVPFVLGSTRLHT
jgi:hypothetical protein